MDLLDELLEVCTSSDSYQLNLKRKLNLKKIEKQLSKEWEVVAATPVVLLVKVGKSSVSVYQSGKVLFKDFNKSGARKHAKKFLKIIGELI